MGKQFMGGIASDVVKRTDHSHHVAQVVMLNLLLWHNRAGRLH